MNKFTNENLTNIKDLVTESTGVTFKKQRGFNIRMRTVIITALIVVLATAGAYAGYRISLSKDILEQNSMTMPGGEFYISRPFGISTDHSSFGKEHPGIDFPAPEGTPVLAAADGTVSDAGFTQGYGNYVIIDHGDGYSTVYAHLNTILKEQGDEIKTGDEIGTVGNTGMSTGPHLHFELRIDGQPVDPEDYWQQ